MTLLSLNDRLETGGNYMPLLFEILIRFRTKPIALTADIEKAFLQIGINESDRDSLRFLWFEDVSKPNPSFVHYHYKRLLFGLNCSPALLGMTIKRHVSQFEQENPAVTKVLNRLYAVENNCFCLNLCFIKHSRRERERAFCL